MTDAASPASEPLPRPLDAFERLMLADDRPRQPMRFFVEFRVRGPLREDLLRQSVAAAARRHPLLGSRILRRRGVPHWVAADLSPKVVWHPGPAAPEPWRPAALGEESGLRCVVLPDGTDRHRVVMQFHHAVCDGVAGLEFAGDVWSLYGGGSPRPFAAPTDGRLRPRREPSRAAAAGRRGGLAEAWDFARFRPMPLARVPGPAPDEPPGVAPLPPYAWHEFDRPETTAIRAAAGRLGGSLNDLVVAAVMRAALAWNSAAAGRPGDVRITLPVSLRSPGRREPAHNDMAYAFLDRTVAACSAPGPLTASVAAATDWILEHGAARAFLSALEPLSRVPGGLWLATRLPTCFSTAVVSCVGDPSRRMRIGLPKRDGYDAPGPLVIERCIGAPPLRPGTRAALGITTYAGRLAVCCLCSAHDDPRYGATLFLDRVRAAIGECAAAAEGGPTG